MSPYFSVQQEADHGLPEYLGICARYTSPSRGQGHSGPGTHPEALPGTVKYLINEKAFQHKTNLPLTDRCMGYIVNKFEHVQRGRAETRWWGSPKSTSLNRSEGSGARGVSMW